jgi:hypothetical protein
VFVFVRACSWVLACMCVHTSCVQVCERLGVCMCVHACSFTHPACKAHESYFVIVASLAVPYFRHYLINGTILGKNLLNLKCGF